MPKLESLATVSALSRAKGAVFTQLTVSAVFGLALGACGDGAGPSGSGGAVGSGGVVGSGGASASTGGTSPSGGSAPSGGTTSTGGTTPSGGTTSSGGTSSGGSENGSGGGGPTGGASGTGGGGSDTCEMGSTMGNEVLFIGESFVQASTIPEETTNLARAAGSLGGSDSYVDHSESGTWIGPGGPGKAIPQQYADNSSGIRFVLMDGGGNDCWQGGQESHRNAALDAAEQLFEDMGANGVEKVVYFFYPDPIGSQFASLTACLDLLRPEMKALCDAQTAPTCHWLDLREAWEGHPEYTSDGIHVAGPGNVPTATAIFETMQENCVAP